MKLLYLLLVIWPKTYRWHELVRTADAGHFVLVQVFLDEPLDVLVPLHEADVRQVDAEQDGRLVPVDVVVAEEQYEDEQWGGVEGTVAEERPPGEREDGAGEESAHPDDEEDVEDGAADDGADADVVEGDEHADHGGEELGRGAAGGHEGGAGDILGDVQLLDDHVQRRHEELVAHDGQRDEHVDDAEDVQEDRSVAPLLQGEQVLREEGVLLDVREVAELLDLLQTVRLGGVVLLEGRPAEGQQ